MNSYEKYYLESLYPLQDGVMNIIQKLNTPFYLTGGTALSRHYFNHRYSDDLDLFVNSDDSYIDYVELIYFKLDELSIANNFVLDKQLTKRAESFSQFFILPLDNADIRLKIDLINDVASNFGTKEQNKVLGVVDSWRNILSNKFSAIYRFEPKDLADIWVICKNKSINWDEIITETKSKEAGIDTDGIYKVLTSVPENQLAKVKWTSEVDCKKVKEELVEIAKDIFLGNNH